MVLYKISIFVWTKDDTCTKHWIELLARGRRESQYHMLGYVKRLPGCIWSHLFESPRNNLCLFTVCDGHAEEEGWSPGDGGWPDGRDVYALSRQCPCRLYVIMYKTTQYFVILVSLDFINHEKFNLVYMYVCDFREFQYRHLCVIVCFTVDWTMVGTAYARHIEGDVHRVEAEGSGRVWVTFGCTKHFFLSHDHFTIANLTNHNLDSWGDGFLASPINPLGTTFQLLY